MDKKPNVILITIDSLRADHLGFMGYGKDITPNLDKLAEESVVFRNAFATGPISPHSVPSILTSTFPLDYQGPRKMERPRVFISEVLKENGFVTAAFHSSPFLSDFFGYNKGWDYFKDIVPSYDQDRFKDLKSRKINVIFSKITNFCSGLLKKISSSTFPQLYFWALFAALRIRGSQDILKVKAEKINKLVQEFIDAEKEKSFFVWAHYMDIHDPYISKKRYLQSSPLSYSEIVGRHLVTYSKQNNCQKKIVKKFVKNNIEKSIELYDQIIEYVDEQIGNLIDFLKKKNIYQNTIIIITADHGDAFFEHGAIGHSINLYNELLRVPLLIRIPGAQPGRIDKKVSLIDIASTICDVLCIRKPSSFKGGNLFEDGGKSIFYQTATNTKNNSDLFLTDINEISQCKMGCQHDSWKYIIDYDQGKEQLYNLKEDPGEEEDLVDENSEILLAMRKKVEDFIRENPPLSLVK